MAGLVARALEARGMAEGAAPYGQPTEIFPAKLLAVASGATADEPPVRVQGSRPPDSRVVRL